MAKDRCNAFDNGSFNVFRHPVGRQFLTDGERNGLIQVFLATNASCIINVHSYARWNGEIIGQSAPSNEIFASLWGSIASEYVNNGRQFQIIFGVIWVRSIQAAVTATRQAGAATQLIPLPGNDYTSAETFISDGSMFALGNGLHESRLLRPQAPRVGPLARSSPDLLEIDANGLRGQQHQDAFGLPSACLRPTCRIAFVQQYSDVFLGYVGRAADYFDSSYALCDVPTDTDDV
ncbi:glycoside hydrolase family 5 protein [Phanerochaete carnosa HHB-10118-sp]|uniref:cellulase n=1 Tax=Phanerochaete carnosa (strain HHB-10118-sp) TaxID=650164 RepID=K5X313_PHACS|nr:glycoside hydrolase family 5 protein [Phanerochaete carnosa HHB-10118-sp]EKM57197.1 glycoside hydrolase family 5 protein [Phanerochaete carnosa HHB-10118-sp]